ncbi:hypothetical protein IQ247_07085 [Plectonema cf. radiosum LEGE 06105]|uniref:Uncharacterized protein n=1 Tax=Plectonema cf. radiosum LEGE 06105 TaxID=945769 RepID=A0A8J7F298_9CYAN|nr:hypothetical protein [Plectonema radiosum]MBE9212478.1 hypothetical protein [Plectonema cf. radiosum LEGE 06105]
MIISSGSLSGKYAMPCFALIAFWGSQQSGASISIAKCWELNGTIKPQRFRASNY